MVKRPMVIKTGTNQQTFIFAGILLLLLMSTQKSGRAQSVSKIINPMNRMKIEIWSDVMCPFCYIGKRKFETALEKFKYKEYVEIEWKSFELNPSLKTDTTKSIVQYLSESKGWSEKQTISTIKNVVEMAQDVGLAYDFDRMKVSNSFDAHRFTHFAKTKGKQNQAEEALFDAYFIKGKDVSDHKVLLALGSEIGLSVDSLTVVLNGTDFSDEVKKDVYEASQLGISGVPFFVLNRKYGISGAQDSSVFLKNLEKAFEEWQKENSTAPLKIINGKVCKPDGSCD